MEIVNTALMVIEPDQKCVFMYTDKAFEAMPEEEVRVTLRVLFHIFNELISRKEGFLLEQEVNNFIEKYPALNGIFQDLIEKNIFRRMVCSWETKGQPTRFCYRCFYSAWSFHENMFVFYVSYASMLFTKRKLEKTNKQGIFMYDKIS